MPKSSDLRSLTRFIKHLGSARTIEDVITWVQQEFKKFARVKEPILVFADSHHHLRVFYFQSKELRQKVIKTAWLQNGQIRFNDVKDSQYLANVFGRPFARILAIPIRTRRRLADQRMKIAGILYFEHSLKKEETSDFLAFVENRLQALSLALDRLFLEQQLIEASSTWERTFDGLQDAVAIFDSDRQIIRANRVFSDQLADVPLNDLFSERFSHNDRDFEVRSYPIAFGHDQTPTNIINHYVDVTASNRLQKQMIQGEKMAALGHLAGHIAHELNNPLTGIRSLAQLLIPQAESGTNLKNDLVEVEHAAQRCQDIITNLREFSSGDYEQKQKLVDLNEIVRKTLSLLKAMISKYRLELNLSGPKLDVYVEPHLTQQVLFNLIKNACQAMSEGGRLKIETMKNDSDVVLSVSDTGSGIPSDLHSKIFEFFFTTKKEGQGTGLGLSMSRNIIEKFGGRIDFDSQVGIGSEFRIALPIPGKANSI